MGPLFHRGGNVRAWPPFCSDPLLLLLPAARPTTLEGSDTAMSFTHQLELSIMFEADPNQPHLDEDGDRLLSRYRTIRPVSIYSCAAGWASVVLPEVSRPRMCLPPRTACDVSLLHPLHRTVFRHRMCFHDRGRVSETHRWKGEAHQVSPLHMRGLVQNTTSR